MAMLFFTLCEIGGNGTLKKLGVGLTLCLAIAAALNFRMNWNINQTQQTRRGEIHVRSHEPLLDFLNTHTRPGDEVFVYPYQPIYYFFEQLTNPTRYSYLLYHFQSAEQFTEATHDLDRKQVRYVVFDSELSGDRLATMFPAYRQPANSQLIMEPYLKAHYGLVSNLGRFHILQRLDHPR